MQNSCFKAKKQWQKQCGFVYLLVRKLKQNYSTHLFKLKLWNPKSGFPVQQNHFFLISFFLSNRIFIHISTYLSICISTIWNNPETTYNRWEWCLEVLKQVISLWFFVGFFLLLEHLFHKHHKIFLSRSALRKKEKAITMDNQEICGRSPCADW